MILSIIIPVYNVELYIIKCIKSLMAQDINDYELIIVDDGSTDESISLIEETFNDDRIVIIHQENKGLSEARNTGLKHASGDFIWFFDSDDWCDEMVLNDIIKILSKDIDILYFNKFYLEKNAETSILSHNYNLITGKDLSFNIYFEPVQFYIFRRNFLQENKLTFLGGIYHEDVLFTPIALYKAEKIVAYNQPVYHLLRRTGSISQTINPKRCYDLMKILTLLNRFANEEVALKDKYKWGHCIANEVNNLLMLSRFCNKSVHRDLIDYFTTNGSFMQFLIHDIKVPTKVLGILHRYFNINIVNSYNFLCKLRYNRIFGYGVKY